MANLEKRFIRIEDWNGNIYYPESSSSNIASGVIIDATEASTVLDANVYTDGTVVSDPKANNGKAILLSSSGSDMVLVKAKVRNIPFGSLSINLRLMSSAVVESTKYFKVICSYVDDVTRQKTVLSTNDITGAMLKTAGQYTDIGLNINYNGTATTKYHLEIEIDRYGDSGAVSYFDQLIAMKSIIII